jgi:hypothetical protein
MRARITRDTRSRALSGDPIHGPLELAGLRVVDAELVEVA